MATQWKSLVLVSLISLSSAFAQDTDPLHQIYPYKPLTVDEISGKVSRLVEDSAPLKNIFEIEARGLVSAQAKTQPWSGSYWPLNQGQIVNTYQDKSLLKFWKYLSWENNVNSWKKREEKFLPLVLNVEEEELAKMAPSEKYDMLMGDTTFDLTHRVWEFAEKWGNSKKWGFLSSIEIPEGYRVPKANTLMALWEGICHGWAVAAGGYPRPLKTVTITLPNGKRLPFYPADIKALVSLMFANSIVQDNVIVEGFRCNAKRPKKDKNGRYIDELPKKEGEVLLPRCADVHPAVWHMAMVNINGVQGRSLIVEVDANAKVNNHPLMGYEYKYFNPKTGKEASLKEAIVSIDDYEKDPYRSARNPNTKSIVGIEMKYKFLGWTFPKADETDGEENDKINDKNFNYDLELDAEGNIIGGQWRTTKKARGLFSRLGSTNQPDFFWVLPKNHMSYFKNLPLESWDGQGIVPASWKEPAMAAHSFTYNVTREYGFDEKCTVISNKDKSTKEVPCEFKYPRPQPLINVVNQLLEMSRQ
ncbi:MAG: hypothetical protein K2P81_05300 [Bacteriovoracaceae bacterium]|nr:hypothetical protein [Bacteriovoracaceae bacterium]